MEIDRQLLKELEEEFPKEKNFKYVSEYHKFITLRKFRAIKEMKKIPTNYEEEYARHQRMHEELKRKGEW